LLHSFFYLLYSCMQEKLVVPNWVPPEIKMYQTEGTILN
jgi:hypothetical protein